MTSSCPSRRITFTNKEKNKNWKTKFTNLIIRNHTGFGFPLLTATVFLINLLVQYVFLLFYPNGKDKDKTYFTSHCNTKAGLILVWPFESSQKLEDLYLYFASTIALFSANNVDFVLAIIMLLVTIIIFFYTKCVFVC